MNIQQRLIQALIAVMLGLLACRRDAQPTPASLPLSPGEVTRTLLHDGVTRSYLLHIPSSFDPTQPAPVVLIFHGGGGNAQNAIRMTGFNRQSDRSGFLAVYPNGTGRLDDLVLTWNGGECCGYAQENNVDDVGFVRALLTDLSSSVRMDAQRVYATGMSNGAIFAYRLACEMSDVFAAVGPVAGTQNVECLPEQPVSIIHFHGTADAHLPYAGGVGEESLTDVEYNSVMDSVLFWAQFNACPDPPVVVENGIISHLGYGQCASQTSVQLYTIHGGLHAWPGSEGPGWPGGDMPTPEIDATRVIWDFFAAHPKR